MIAKDLPISQCGDIADTGFIIESRIEDNTTLLYDSKRVRSTLISKEKNCMFFMMILVRNLR